MVPTVVFMVVVMVHTVALLPMEEVMVHTVVLLPMEEVMVHTVVLLPMEAVIVHTVVVLHMEAVMVYTVELLPMEVVIFLQEGCLWDLLLLLFPSLDLSLSMLHTTISRVPVLEEIIVC